MQLFVNCGKTVVLECDPHNHSVWDLKQQLAQRRHGRADQMVLVHCGRQLQDEELLSSYENLQPCSTLHLTSRLCGGGGDGGSTGAESRSCYLEMYMKKKPDKVNPAEELHARWTRCHLTNEPLAPPCVIDELGYVYNKEALVHALLLKSLPSALAHITGLRSVLEVKLERNTKRASNGPKAAARGADQPSNDADFCCPVTGLEYNGRFKFVAHRGTGHVVSEKALKEAPAVVCELFGGKWAQDDLIPVNPTPEVLQELQEKLVAKLTAEREKKAKKKAAKAAAAGGPANGVEPTSAAADGAPGGHAAGADADANGNGTDGTNGKKRSPSPGITDPTGGAPAAAAAAAAAAGKGAAAAAAGTSSNPMAPPAAKKAKAMEVMPSHANASVYASLFTSSRQQPEKETYLCRNLSSRGMNLT